MSVLVSRTNELQRVGAVALVSLLCGCSSSPQASRVSVVLVTTDTLRADSIGCYGGTTPTPNMDRLAAEGTRFNDVTAHSPITLPSHASILTGTTPLYHGIKDNGRYRLPDEIDTLAEMFKREGYSTGAFVGAIPVHSRFGLGQGFDVYDERFVGERRAGEVVTGALDWLGQQGNRPFFLWIHVFDPHSPYQPPEPFRSRFGDTYEGEIAYLDDALGPLFSALGDDTLTVVTSDHGESLGEHGEDTHSLFIYDATLRVPLIFRGPGIPRGASFPEQVRSIDILPSILELVALPEACTACQGRSLVPTMRGEEVEPAPSYAETFFPRLSLGWSELRSIRWKGWKFISAPEPELYDLTTDPGELTNLAGKEPERIGELSSMLDDIDEASTGSLEALPSEIDPKTLELLGSLGYISADNAMSREGELPDPKSRIDSWKRLTRAKDDSDAGRFDEAVDELQSILDEDEHLLVAHYYLAEVYYRMGKYEETAGQCKRLLTLHPEHARAALMMAESFFRLGRIQEAAKTYEEAAQLDTLTADPLVRLANLYLETRNIDKAREALDRATRRDPRNALVLYVQGKLFLLEGRIQEAEKAFGQAIQADPYEVGVRVHLANLLLNQRRTGEAETVVREGATLLPQDVTLHMTLGRVMALSGRPDQAIVSFEKALELQPDSPLILTSLGIAFLENREEEKGFAMLTRSLELDPNQPQIQQLLQQRRVP